MHFIRKYKLAKAESFKKGGYLFFSLKKKVLTHFEHHFHKRISNKGDQNANTYGKIASAIGNRIKKGL